VQQALNANHISFVSLDQGGKTKDEVERFKKDKTISVFLLHAERESSGLTLTSCRVVHLLEPVLRHSFELQAIGRVDRRVFKALRRAKMLTDRLGQEKETTVYW
jgi:E3 ubiquitin-protein ligase SHPRH